MENILVSTIIGVVCLITGLGFLGGSVIAMINHFNEKISDHSQNIATTQKTGERMGR